MEATRREFSAEGHDPVLQTFLSSNTELLHGLTADGKTAQVGFNPPKIRPSHSRAAGLHTVMLLLMPSVSFELNEVVSPL